MAFRTKHSEQTVDDGIHGVVAFEFAGQTQILAYAGFTSADVGKVALQTDLNHAWFVKTVAAGGTASLSRLGRDPRQRLVLTTNFVISGAGQTEFGQFELQPSDLYGASRFSLAGVGNVSSAGLTLQVGLAGVTLGTSIANSTIEFTGTSAGFVESSDLPLAESGGNLRLDSTVYMLSAQVAGATAGSVGTIGSVHLRLE